MRWGGVGIVGKGKIIGNDKRQGLGVFYGKATRLGVSRAIALYPRPDGQSALVAGLAAKALGFAYGPSVLVAADHVHTNVFDVGFG